MTNHKAPLAYKSEEFLSSRPARPIRILSEYFDPEKRFNEMKVNNTIVFFGSARTSSDKNDPFSKYYWAAEEFAYELANWSKELKKESKDFFICTGGGPGIMEAANRGAHRAKEPSIGLNISLPFEQNPNDYITPELNFEFHYFYMRKLWFLYHAKALIVFPGGFGTMDELFETLTLIQTKKLDEKGKIPVFLYDKTFWQDMINFDKMVEYKLISKEDLKLFEYFDSAKEGLELIKPRVLETIDIIKKS